MDVIFKKTVPAVVAYLSVFNRRDSPLVMEFLEQATGGEAVAIAPPFVQNGRDQVVRAGFLNDEEIAGQPDEQDKEERDYESDDFIAELGQLAKPAPERSESLLLALMTGHYWCTGCKDCDPDGRAAGLPVNVYAQRLEVEATQRVVLSSAAERVATKAEVDVRKSGSLFKEAFITCGRTYGMRVMPRRYSRIRNGWRQRRGAALRFKRDRSKPKKGLYRKQDIREGKGT